MGKKILKIVFKTFVFFLGIMSGIAFMHHYLKLKSEYYPSDFDKDMQIIEKKAKQAQKNTNMTDKDFDFEILEPSEKKSITFSIFKDKTIFLNVWATWCAPCREELPSMNALKQKFINNKNITFLNISDDDLSKISKFKEKHKYSLNFYLHNNNLPAILSGSSIPRTYIIKNQKIIYKLVGARNWNTDDIIKLLR